MLTWYTIIGSFFAGIFIATDAWHTSCDAPRAYGFGFQDPATEHIEWMLHLHDTIMIDLIIILLIVLQLLYKPFDAALFQTNTQSSWYKLSQNWLQTRYTPASNKAFSHSQYLEIFWTVIPALVLLSIAAPTFRLLYAIEDFADPALVLKITGHQWYWSYEFVKNTSDVDYLVNFSSYIINTSDLSLGALRLLEVDTRLHLPTLTHIRLLITSADVLHSWTIPSFGIKLDACPGRLCQTSMFIKRPGVFFGQCSEICGVNHGFMPIVVRAISPKIFFASEEI